MLTVTGILAAAVLGAKQAENRDSKTLFQLPTLVLCGKGASINGLVARQFAVSRRPLTKYDGAGSTDPEIAAEVLPNGGQSTLSLRHQLTSNHAGVFCRHCIPNAFFSSGSGYRTLNVCSIRWDSVHDWERESQNNASCHGLHRQSKEQLSLLRNRAACLYLENRARSLV